RISIIPKAYYDFLVDTNDMRKEIGTVLMWLGLFILPLIYVILKFSQKESFDDGIWGWSIPISLFIALIGKLIRK
ncbi:hypothetical protein, partial [uncultured Duncaniella sp.]